MHFFNTSTQEAEDSESLSSRKTWSTEWSSGTALAIQKNPVYKQKNKQKEFQVQTSFLVMTDMYFLWYTPPPLDLVCCDFKSIGKDQRLKSPFKFRLNGCILTTSRRIAALEQSGMLYTSVVRWGFKADIRKVRITTIRGFHCWAGKLFYSLSCFFVSCYLRKDHLT